MKCIQCGKEVTTKFCPECGAKQPDVDPPVEPIVHGEDLSDFEVIDIEKTPDEMSTVEDDRYRQTTFETLKPEGLSEESTTVPEQTPTQIEAKEISDELDDASTLPGHAYSLDQLRRKQSFDLTSEEEKTLEEISNSKMDPADFSKANQKPNYENLTSPNQNRFEKSASDKINPPFEKDVKDDPNDYTETAGAFQEDSQTKQDHANADRENFREDKRRDDASSRSDNNKAPSGFATSIWHGVETVYNAIADPYRNLITQPNAHVIIGIVLAVIAMMSSLIGIASGNVMFTLGTILFVLLSVAFSVLLYSLVFKVINKDLPTPPDAKRMLSIILLLLIANYILTMLFSTNHLFPNLIKTALLTFVMLVLMRPYLTKHTFSGYAIKFLIFSILISWLMYAILAIIMWILAGIAMSGLTG